MMHNTVSCGAGNNGDDDDNNHNHRNILTIII